LEHAWFTSSPHAHGIFSHFADKQNSSEPHIESFEQPEGGEINPIAQVLFMHREPDAQSLSEMHE